MGFKIGEMVAELRVDGKQFDSQMKTSKMGLVAFGGGMLIAFNQAKQLFGSIIGGAIRAGRRIAALVVEQVQLGDALSKTAEKLGMNVKALDELRYVARLTGVQANTLDMAMQRVTRRIAEAAKGFGEARGALQELGLDAKRLAKMEPDKAFLEIADAMQHVEDPAHRLRLAFKLFDSEGAALVRTLKLGKEGIREFMHEAEALGIAWDPATAELAVKFNDSMTRIKGAWLGVKRTVFEELGPAINETMEGLVQWWKQHNAEVRIAITLLSQAAREGAKRGARAAAE